jgi:hypothetical protein
MIRNALFASTTVLVAALFLLLDRLTFLAPSKKLLFLHCGGSMAVFATALGLNLFAAFLAINRKFFLKDTGKKLAHLDKHLQSGDNDIIPQFLQEGQ